MTDQNRKTLRSFYCRDYLWELFEQMTHELGCSMDYLINESMRLYARSRDFPADGQNPMGDFGQQNGMSGGPGFGQPMDRFNVGPQNSVDHRTFDRIPPVGGQQRPQQNPFGGAPMPPAPPSPGGLAAGPPPPPPRPGPPTNSWGAPPQPSGGIPQPSPPQPNPPQPGGGIPQPGGFGAQGFGQQTGGRPPLFLIFNNNRYTIEKDKFVIGRGSQQTDLTIRDGNISRKHCAVIFHNGSYYIKDLGSTNGIEFRSNRIESKKIEDGDTFYLCDYELRFTYH